VVEVFGRAIRTHCHDYYSSVLVCVDPHYGGDSLQQFELLEHSQWIKELDKKLGISTHHLVLLRIACEHPRDWTRL
jgi:hypothetical protein